MKKYPLLMRPVSKEILWGGSKLKKEYAKTAPFEKLAESWELTVRKDGMSVIANGEYAGMPLERYLSLGKTDVLGTNCAKYDRFPLLIKFIDAADNLSVQVHPDDDYALPVENEFGKTEMWYIMDAEPGAKLVYGLADGCTIEDFAQAIADGVVEEKLNYVEVHRGEVYFIPSGQVHAIGSGILIAEIQQNSNITYRVYDYNRRQSDGSLRQLHTEKALDVIKIRSDEEIEAIRLSKTDSSSCSEMLCACDYFTSAKYVTSKDNVAVIHTDVTSFVSILVLESTDGYLEMGDEVLPLHRGDSYFIPSGNADVRISGNTEIIATKIN